MRWSTARRLLLGLLAVAGLAYPVLVYVGLASYSAHVLLSVLVVLILVRALLFLSARRMLPAALSAALASALWALGQVEGPLAIRLYPVIVSLTLAGIFGLTMVRPPPMIERFARLRDPHLDAFALRYTRTLTAVWIGFFLLNAAIAGWTVVAGSLEQWTLYNGLISYLLIGLLFFGEWPVRRVIRRRAEARGRL